MRREVQMRDERERYNKCEKKEKKKKPIIDGGYWDRLDDFDYTAYR